MDDENNVSDPRRSSSVGRTSSAGSSLRRRSLSLLGVAAPQMDDDLESEIVSQAGDIGDRALQSNRYSGSGSFHFSVDNVVETGVVVPVQEESPLPSEIISPLSTDPIVSSDDKMQDNKKELPLSLEYISYLVHLAVFGILGTLTRYLLQKLFGPGVAGVTRDRSILYPDLPSNMVGSFLMGWLGVVFKGDISGVSDHLATGLTTGYLGSLTTFSGWNQKMLELSVDGQWVSSILGFLIGLFLASYSIIFGVETANGFRWLLKRLKSRWKSGIPSSSRNWSVDSYKCHFAVLVVLLLMLGLLWSVSGVLEKKEFNRGGSEAQLWLACIVAPLGVWIRWFLARLNGRGLGSAGFLKWVPFGTLAANVSAACVMAALSTVKKAMNTKNCDTVATGLQFGLLGCLSTVSTFIAEFNAMRQSNQPWRAYAYATGIRSRMEFVHLLLQAIKCRPELQVYWELSQMPTYWDLHPQELAICADENPSTYPLSHLVHNIQGDFFSGRQCLTLPEHLKIELAILSLQSIVVRILQLVIPLGLKKDKMKRLLN